MDIPNGRSFELHCHSHYSKGKKIPCEALPSPRDVVRAAKRDGLAGVALTDHDNIRGWEEASAEARKRGIIFIPGIEVETKNGHILGLGISESIKPGLTVDETVEAIRDQGGLAVAAHPFDIRNLGSKHEMSKADAVEVFNAMSIDRVSNIFAEKRARKLNMPMIAVTDAHTVEMIGTATTMMDAYDVDSILREIGAKRVELRKGYMPMSLLVDWARERMRISYEDVMGYIKNNYSAPKAWLSEALLHKFLFSRNRAPYDALARFGASCSVIYGGIKALTYL